MEDLPSGFETRWKVLEMKPVWRGVLVQGQKINHRAEESLQSTCTGAETVWTTKVVLQEKRGKKLFQQKETG